MALIRFRQSSLRSSPSNETATGLSLLNVSQSHPHPTSKAINILLESLGEVSAFETEVLYALATR